MVSINNEALEALATALRSLLPPVADPDLQPSLVVLPTRIGPAGIGGVVGTNADPRGEIVARRLEATALVTVRGEDNAGLDSAVADVTRALVAADRAALQSSGILRITLGNIGSRPEERPGGGPDRAQERELTFRVLYEFLKLPEAAEGVIQEIPIDLEVNETGARPRIVLSSGFMEGSLDWFEVVDDPLATQGAPSQWLYNAAEARIEQRANIRGGSAGVNANKPGTYLVLRTGAGRPAVRDFTFEVEFSSTDSGGIGVVFRWQDVDNFYFFLTNNARGYRLMGRKVAGTFANLATPALDNTSSFAVGARHILRVTALGDTFRVYMDGGLALTGADASIAGPGRVGFMTHANNRAFFHHISLVQLLEAP